MSGAAGDAGQPRVGGPLVAPVPGERRLVQLMHHMGVRSRPDHQARHVGSGTPLGRHVRLSPIGRDLGEPGRRQAPLDRRVTVQRADVEEGAAHTGL